MLIKYPQTIDEAAQLLRTAHDEKKPVIPAGHLTGLKSNPAVVRDDVLVVSTRDLNRMISLEPENLLTIVEAGQTPAQVEAALKPTGLYWPVTGQGARTLGAIMAEGRLGAETMARGSMIDWILGTALISPEGRLVKSGGRTLKNVSGYDFTRLAWRSRGRLGLCASFILKLLPRPESAPVLEVATAGPAEAADLARAVITQKLWPEALRLVYDRRSTALLVWLTGFAEVTETKAAAVADLFGSGLIISHQDGFAFWEEQARKWPADDPGLVSLMGSRRAILELAELLEDDGLPGVTRADLDVGGGRAVLALNGETSVDHIAAQVDGLIPDRFNPSGPVYERLKKGLDPEGLLLPEGPA